MDKVIKIILAILFFSCLADMPYGYYQLVRFSGLVGFIILAYLASDKENKVEMIIFICLAVLFQPLFKISLGRVIWNIVDVIVGIGLFASVFFSTKNNASITVFPVTIILSSLIFLGMLHPHQFKPPV